MYGGGGQEDGGGGQEDGGTGWEMVAEGIPAAYDGGDDFSVFPPSLHEGLSPTLAIALDPHSSSASHHHFLESVGGVQQRKEVDEKACHVSRMRISESARRLVDSGIELIRSKLAVLRGKRGGCNGGAVWSFAALAGFAGVLMYMRRQHRREKELLLFLMLEKDERINQLMDQIVRMSEAMAASHKVLAVTRT